MRPRALWLGGLLVLSWVLALVGCGASSPPPEPAPATTAGGEPAPSATPAPDTGLPPPDPVTGYTRIVAGAGDSVGSLPGSPESVYLYRFRQVDPGSNQFTFQDRDLSFYFRPTPTALHMSVENRQNQPVWIEWDRSTFLDPVGNKDLLAHSTTRWQDRFGSQAPTQIAGLQRYSDYLLPKGYLVNPAGRPEQLHRALFPEDHAALQFVDRIFGVDLVFRIENQFRTYPFRFRVVSVIPR